MVCHCCHVPRPNAMRATGLIEVMVTGGIPPGIDMPCSADRAYTSLYRRVMLVSTHTTARTLEGGACTLCQLACMPFRARVIWKLAL